MCGIVGVAGLFGQKKELLFRNLFLIDQIRGVDSSGIILVRSFNKEALVDKDIGGPTNLYGERENYLLDERGIPYFAPKVMIGHNRAKTIGQVSVSNAHPHSYGDIHGVHNGTLKEWGDIDGDEEGNSFTSDSKAIFHSINKIGAKETWEKIEGAASLVWWDEKRGTLNFLRNKDRPMNMAWTDDGQTLIWASEAWMITQMCRNLDIILKTFSREVKDDKGVTSKVSFKVFSTELNTHYELKVEANKVSLLNETVYEQGKQVEKFQYKVALPGNYYRKPVEGWRPRKWLKSFFKAPDFSKTHVTLSYVSSIQENGAWFDFVVGTSSKGSRRVEIYPANKAELEELRNHLFQKTRFTIEGIPRCRAVEGKSGNSAGSILVRYSQLSFNAPAVLLYKSFGDRMVPKEEWLESTEAFVSGRCSWCDKNLSIHNADKYVWYRDAVLCEDCKHDNLALGSAA